MVVYVTGKDPSVATSGQPSYVRAHARAAVRAGFEPHIFCPSWRTDTTDTDFGVLHRVRTSLRLPRLFSRTSQFPRSFIHWHTWRLTPAVTAFLSARPGPHLIHGFASWGYVAVRASEQLRSQGIRTATINSLYTTAEHESRAKMRGVTRVHGPFHSLLYRANHRWIERCVTPIERRAYHRSTVVTLNYESVRQLAERSFGSRGDVRLLPYTSEVAFREQRYQRVTRSNPRTPHIVSISRHDPRKGVHVLLRALARLRRDGIAFEATLVSGGPLLDAHRRLARRLAIADVVSLPGWVDDPVPHLRNADVFVLPSLEEGSGSVSLIEALEAGLPVVASRLDGIPEDVTHGESAVLVEPNDVDALADALAAVLTDPSYRRRLVHGARRVFETRFRPGAMVDAVGALYGELLGVTSQPPIPRRTALVR